MLVVVDLTTLCSNTLVRKASAQRTRVIVHGWVHENVRLEAGTLHGPVVRLRSHGEILVELAMGGSLGILRAGTEVVS